MRKKQARFLADFSVDFSDKAERVKDIGVRRAAGFYDVEYWFVKNVWDLVFPVSLKAFRVA